MQIYNLKYDIFSYYSFKASSPIYLAYAYRLCLILAYRASVSLAPHTKNYCAITRRLFNEIPQVNLVVMLAVLWHCLQLMRWGGNVSTQVPEVHFISERCYRSKSISQASRFMNPPLIPSPRKSKQYEYVFIINLQTFLYGFRREADIEPKQCNVIAGQF